MNNDNTWRGLKDLNQELHGFKLKYVLGYWDAVQARKNQSCTLA